MSESPTADPTTRSRGRTVAAAVLAAIVLVAVAFAAGRWSAATPPDPSTTSAEAGFARDMQIHHAQAVEMSFLIRDRSGDERLRLMAYDIATAQATQSGQLYDWLEQWGLPQAPAEPSMTWMSRPAADGAHDEHSADHVPGEPMPGLASDADLDRLRAADGVEAERLFLELMIVHHEGGVEMAEAILARTDRPEVRRLAQGILEVQTSEISAMRDMLAARA